MLARPEQRGRHREVLGALQGLDRRARGDLAVQRDFHRVVGRRRGTAAGSASPSPTARLRQFDHLERTRAVGQPADKPAFLQRRNQPVHARLRFEVERLAHLVEARG